IQVPALLGSEFNALFCDGSAHTFRKGIDPELFSALVTPNGGEDISAEKIIAAHLASQDSIESLEEQLRAKRSELERIEERLRRVRASRGEPRPDRANREDARGATTATTDPTRPRKPGRAAPSTRA